ncbi:YheC/YheD family endospore coat-associated protein [Robertmurraya massiliosenegalensis]|uniref:YheC/YheD family endospore coat-associated protein n=1 Tax=Robertmurraya massiliosenegalensis TaxID=1287657 RepID=UPI00031ED446|nr:YheC/YheD family protein [Robertmurraya massiliosenegalensis]
MSSTSYLPITIIPTKTFHDPYNTIFFSSSLLNFWGMKPGQEVTLCIGTKARLVTVDTKALEKEQILINEQLLLEFPLPLKRLSFLSQFDKKQQRLFIGPIFALVTEIHESEENEPSFRSIHSFAEELHYTVETAGGLFYIFHIKDFSLDEMNGYFYDKDHWKKSKFVLPNVIYNRIHSRKLESSSFFKSKMEEINLKQIAIFNERFLSKWEVHNLLIQETHLHPFLPETALYESHTFPAFLEKHKTLFIKPLNGSQGRNIFKVSLEDHHILVNTTSIREHEQIKSFQHIEEFINWFQKRQKQTPFIMQQGIPLAMYVNRPLDFRILCHKDHSDSWRVTSIVARVSAKTEFVSNLARGGEMMKAAKPLTHLFDHQTARSHISFMKELSIEVCKIISQSSQGIVGELGIDIGIDSNGRIWIIEVNSKPSKNMEEQQTKIRPSTKAIYEYGTALAFQHLKRKNE